MALEPINMALMMKTLMFIKVLSVFIFGNHAFLFGL